MPVWDKILHPAAFAEAVFNYQLLPSQLINLMALILPWLELILGVLLLTGIWLPGATLGVNLLLITFLGALIINTARGLNISCGCFSTDTTAVGLSWWDVLRDVFFFSLSGYLLFYHSIRRLNPKGFHRLTRLAESSLIPDEAIRLRTFELFLTTKEMVRGTFLLIDF